MPANTSATGGILQPNPPPAPQPLEDADLVNFFQAQIAQMTQIAPALVRPRWQAVPPTQPDPSTTWAAVGIHSRKADTYPFVGHVNFTVGYLAGGQIDATHQAIALWNAITAGGFHIAVNGGSAVEVDGINLSTCATLFEVAALVQGAILAAGVLAGVQCIWNDGQFVLFTLSGTSPSIAPLTAPSSGTDISAMMMLTSGTMQGQFSGTITGDQLQRHEELELLLSFYGPGADTALALVRDGLQIGQNRTALQLAGMALVSTEDARAVPVFYNNQWYYRVDLPIFINRVIVRTYPIENIVEAVINLLDDFGNQQQIIVPAP